MALEVAIQTSIDSIMSKETGFVFLIGTLMNQYPNRLRVSDSPILHFKVHDSESHQMTFFRLASALPCISRQTKYTKQCVYVPDIETRVVETFKPSTELNLT